MPDLIVFLLDPDKNESEKLQEVSAADFFKKYSVNSIEPNTGNTVLHIAALQNYPKITFHLLNANARVDAINNKKQHATALHYAVGRGYLEVVKILVNNSFRAHTVYYEDEDEYFNTLLDRRVRFDANENELNMTALHLAINTKISSEEEKNNYLNIVEVLLANGANAERRDGRGYTPLHIAVLQGKKEFVKLLLDYGADVNARTWEGRDALKLASKLGQDEIVKLLTEKIKEVASAENNNKRSHNDISKSIEFFWRLCVLQKKQSCRPNR